MNGTEDLSSSSTGRNGIGNEGTRRNEWCWLLSDVVSKLRQSACLRLSESGSGTATETIITLTSNATSGMVHSVAAEELIHASCLTIGLL
jgi:hypothetical protein